MALRHLAIVCALAAAASAQPSSSVLAQANAAAVSGDWHRVDELVRPLFAPGATTANADLAEAHRLAGLAAYFSQRTPDAEAHFVAYLKLDPDGHLDPTLVPPEAVTFFEDVKARHLAELRAARPRERRHFIYTLLPPLGQLQNHERTKAVVVGSAMGAFLVTNVTTYLVLRSWCNSSDLTCDTPVNHAHTAASLRTINIMSGIGFIATYLYGVYDGVVGYRRRTQEHFVAPFATASNSGAVVGVAGSF